MLRSILSRAPSAAFVLAACVSVAPRASIAQARPRAAPTRDTLNAPSLPRDVAREVVELYNAPSTTRVTGAFDLPAERTIVGDVAVLGGAASVAGHIRGRLFVINADLTLSAGARVDGDVVVIGGIVDGRGQATIGGEVRIYRQILAFGRDGERLVAEAPTEEGELGWRRWLLRPDRRRYIGLTLSSGHTYNRVEGLPILVGPSVVSVLGPAHLRLDALLVYRTSGGLTWDSASVGHVVRGEAHFGRERGVRVGARLYDEIAPVERWQLGDAEVGLASFFLHRDFRDYYNRHGGTLHATLFAGENQTITASLGDERWASRDERDPWTLFRNDRPWRPNPRLDDGRVHVASVALHLDTRNDVANPWAGWYLDADLERGVGRYTSFGSVSADLLPGVRDARTPGARDELPGRRTYQRGFVDLRRYNRLSPEAQLNFRLVAGGRVGGDALPLERRLSVTGPGALPGFDFRVPTRMLADAGSCAVQGLEPSGSPAQCERIALGQAELRGALHVGIPFARWPRVAMHTGASWVVFADAGRGWLVGAPRDELVYRSTQLPALSSFLSDVGGGIDLGSGGTADVVSFGAYVAKSVSHPSEPANVFVRVRRRF